MTDMATNERAVLIRFDLYLRFIHRVVSEVKSRAPLGYRVPYALFIGLIKRVRAVSVLIAAGYADQADPIVRAMISAAANLLFIMKTLMALASATTSTSRTSESSGPSNSSSIGSTFARRGRMRQLV
jgi:hypothetical protein